MRSVHLLKVLVITASLALSACVNSYKPPVWEGSAIQSSVGVKAYIDAYLNQYGKMMRKADRNRDTAAIATIFSALAGTTGLALGAGTDFGIVAGSIGSGTTAITGYTKPVDRLQLVGHAINATTCVRNEYSNQDARMGAVGITAGGTNAITGTLTATQKLLDENDFLSRQINDADQIAIDATNAISTSLQAKLANISQVPNYAAAVKEIQDALKQAESNTPATGAPQALLVQDIAEYEARIATCKAQFPS